MINYNLTSSPYLPGPLPQPQSLTPTQYALNVATASQSTAGTSTACQPPSGAPLVAPIRTAIPQVLVPEAAKKYMGTYTSAQVCFTMQMFNPNVQAVMLGYTLEMIKTVPLYAA